MDTKLVVFISALVLLAVVALGCKTQANTAGDLPAGYHKITAAEAKQKMAANQQAVVLDVRTAEEYHEKHLPNAVLLPLAEVKEKAATVLPDKSAEILVYCRSGNRSRQAAVLLLELGYGSVYDFGGIQDWPYEVVQ
nr:rhodanese-like domain-containing protein [uncultured Anaeromusa sp.]